MELDEVVKQLNIAKRDVNNMRVQIAEYQQIVKELSEKLRKSVKYPPSNKLNGLGRSPSGEHE